MASVNLIFIFTDQQRADTIHSPDVRMPHLDRLAGESCHFTDALCSQPVCTPSRATIMTGLYPHATGATLNNKPLDPQVPCLPELLPSAMRQRYTTAYMGKWHLGDEIFAQHGFDHWVSFEDHYEHGYSPGRDPQARSDYHHWLCRHGFLPQRDGKFSRDRAATLPEPYTKPRFLAEQACRFIQEHARDPFILYLNFLEPHMPFFGPRTAEYDPCALRLPANFDHIPGDDTPLMVRLTMQRKLRSGFEWYDLGKEAGWRQMTAAYRGLCTLIDDQLGRICDTIGQAGIADRTILVFTSDHGEMMGSHRMMGKRVMYQESVRIPCTLRLPGQQRGCRVDGPFSLVNLVPTLLDLLGAPVPGHLHGRSLAGELDGSESVRLEEDVLVQWNGLDEQEQAALREREYPEWELALAGSADRIVDAEHESVRTLFTPEGKRFSYSPILGDHELYDLRADPEERTNLATDLTAPGRQAEIDDFLGRLRAIQQRIDDPATVQASLTSS